MDTQLNLDTLNIPSVICETCGTPVATDSDLHNDAADGCPDCSNYWIKEQLLRHFY